MMRRTLLGAAAALVCGLALSGPLAAEEQPSGSVMIKSTSIALGIGVSWGDGQLTFKGNTYKFNMNGLSVVDLGMSTITAVGGVYNLNDVADFSGNYVAGEAGVSVGGGYSTLVMQNQNGVVIKLSARESGAQLTLAAEGMQIDLAD